MGIVGEQSVDIAGGGPDPFLATVRLLSDPQEMERRFAALQQAQAQAAATIALVGPANEVLMIREEVIQTRQKAWDELAAAQAQAKVLLANAEAEARDIKAQAVDVLARQKAEEAQAQTRSMELINEANAKAAEAMALHDDALATARDAENYKSRLVQEVEMARATRVAFEERLQALNDLINSTREAAGRL